jgi:glycosyltransferase involved in cell wall biosynthesis
MEKGRYFRALRRILAGRRCRGIVAISEYARNLFRLQHEHSAEWETLSAKLAVRYPNVVMPAIEDRLGDGAVSGPLRLVFVGAHLARKGGCVALKLAELALARKIDLEVTIISSLQMGNGIWTDPTRPAYFDRWKRLLDLPNVRFFPGLPNPEVLELMRHAHFSILATFGDTFGFSAIEAMANHCPVIATRQGALAEFIYDGENGILLDLPLSAHGDWIHSKTKIRGSAQFEAIFDEEIARLAEQALVRVLKVMAGGDYARMRAEARRTAETMFDSNAANTFWDELYSAATAAR